MKVLELANQLVLSVVHGPKRVLALLMEVAHNALMILIANGVDLKKCVFQLLLDVKEDLVTMFLILALVMSTMTALHAEKLKDVDGVKETLLFAQTNYVQDLLLLAANLIVKTLLLTVILAIIIQDVLGAQKLKNVSMKLLPLVPSKEPVKLATSPELVIHVLQVHSVYGVKIVELANNLEQIVSFLILVIFSAIPSITVNHVTWFLDVDGVMIKSNALM